MQAAPRALPFEQDPRHPAQDGEKQQRGEGQDGVW